MHFIIPASQGTSIFIHLFVLCVFNFCPSPANGQGATTFVDWKSKVNQIAEPQWFIDNIPFLEVPDENIEEVYYYRFSSLKRHLRYIQLGVGFVITEFVHPVEYSQKFGTINGAAGHHIDEARWLRNTRYVKDYINMWAREGAGNQQYSEWIADSSYNAFLLNGDAEFIKSMQTGFVTNFNGWNDRFIPSMNMYILSPHDDAMEHSASSEQTDDPYHGGLGFRPSFNSEMYANAIAIAKIARLNGDTATAEEFETRGESIRQAIMDVLWDKERRFFYHMYYEDNPTNALLDTREEIGFFPWRWEVPDKNDPQYEAAWESLYDPQGFDSAYGPTTCEQRSRWFEGNQTSQCCWWNGNSWPYSTGHTLRALASQVKNYRPTDFANVDSFTALLRKYAVTQYKNGKPYVAECHSALYDFWVCDSRNWSEHYAHSTYVDNVLADLIGIEPQANNSLVINPLVPSTWAYFIVENMPYHGHNVTVLYDKDGTKYSTGNVGLQVFVNGALQASLPQLGRLQVDIPPPIPDTNYGGPKRMENYAANAYARGYPTATTSFTSRDADVWHTVDGRIFYDYIPINRWTNFESPNEEDWIAVDFGPGRVKEISQVKLYIYSDYVTGEGGVDCPTSIRLEYMNTQGSWTPVPNPVLTPAVCVPNDITQIDFTPLRTHSVRALFTRNEAQNTYVGINELEIWAPWPQTPQGVYEAEDGLLNEANIRESPSASSGSFVGQIDGEDAFVEFTGVWVESAGTYSVQIFYANGGTAPGTLNLTVNNIDSSFVSFPVSSGWGQFSPDTFVTVQVPLSRGNNVLIFKHASNFVELDSIKISQ